VTRKEEKKREKRNRAAIIESWNKRERENEIDKSRKKKRILRDTLHHLRPVSRIYTGIKCVNVKVCKKKEKSELSRMVM